jgi:hypothetical protein
VSREKLVGADDIFSLPGGALEISMNDKSCRVIVRDGEASNESNEGRKQPRDCASDGVQAFARMSEKVATATRSRGNTKCTRGYCVQGRSHDTP